MVAPGVKLEQLAVGVTHAFTSRGRPNIAFLQSGAWIIESIGGSREAS